MFKLIIIVLIAIFILCHLSEVIGLIFQLLVTWVGFQIHPLLGLFLLVAYVSDWFSKLIGKKKPEPKKQQEQAKQNKQQSYQQNNYNQQKQYQEQRQQNSYKQQERPKQQTYNKQTSYFAGCNTKEQLKKRHRELCMKYHPDKGGDVEIFKKMQSEYEKLKVKFN